VKVSGAITVIRSGALLAAQEKRKSEKTASNVFLRWEARM
jgi:hypothetical protein